MRPRRKIALALAALAASLLVALLVVPLVFRDRIASRLKAEVNKSVNARVAWGGASLGVLRDFPNVSLSLRGLSVVGVKPFSGDTLVSARDARLVLDLGSVIRYLRGGDRIVIREVELRQPAAHLRVLADGPANWDIARKPERPTATTSRAVAFTLRELRIRDGAVTLDDRKSSLTAAVAGLEETLSGDFAQEKFTFTTRTRADSVSLRFAGVPYLSRVALALDADVNADLRSQRFTFRNDSLRLNNLVLALSGAVTTGQPNLALDVAFSAPSTAFRDILSLVPAIYARDFARVRTSGTMSAAGRVRGDYGPHAFPTLALRARVENGSFRYPDLPLPARDIFLDLAIDNPGGSLDRTVVSLKRFHAAIGGRPLDGALVMRTPVSDPDVDLRLNGTLNLADLPRTVKLEGVKELTGVVAADVAMRARKSQLDAGRYDQVVARGTVDVARLALRSADLPHLLKVDTAALRLTPRSAELTSFAGRIGSSDLRATGSIENLLGFAIRDEELRGRAAVRSSRFDLNEWRSDDKSTEVIPVPPKVDFALEASVTRVLYGTLTAANVRGRLRVKDRRVTVDDLRMEMLGGSVVANGFYETTAPTRPTFDLALRAANLDVPTTFAALNAVQKLAPVARWARGTVSADFAVAGALGRDMTPLFDALSGRGTLESERLALQNFPVLGKVADALKLERLRNPAFEALRASFEIRNGRLFVKPFDVKLGRVDMRVAGSNGIDQSLKYDLALAVPSAELDAASGGVVSKLASQAGRTGLDLKQAEVVELGAQVTGTVTSPTVRPNFSGVANSTREAVQHAVQKEVESRVGDAKQKVDSAADAARRRARAEADRIVGEAEKRAASVRAEARTLAATVRREANERADSLVSRAANPAARLAAQVAADRLRGEADTQAERLVREADARADGIVAQARRQADALVPSQPGT